MSILQDVQTATTSSPIGLIYRKVESPQDLIGHLNTIASNPNLIPIIHLATHGNEEGIKLNGGFVSWNEIMPVLEKINIRIKNRLIVIFALCYGARFITDVKGIGRSPFGMLIAPGSSIKWGLLDDLLKAFYIGLVNGDSLQKALKAMSLVDNEVGNTLFVVTSTERLRLEREALALRIDKGTARHDLMKLYKEMHGQPMPYEIKSQIQYKDGLVNLYSALWKEHVSNFLMLDLIDDKPGMEVRRLLNFKKYYYGR